MFQEYFLVTLLALQVLLGKQKYDRFMNDRFPESRELKFSFGTGRRCCRLVVNEELEVTGELSVI